MKNKQNNNDNSTMETDEVAHFLEAVHEVEGMIEGIDRPIEGVDQSKESDIKTSGKKKTNDLDRFIYTVRNSFIFHASLRGFYEIMSDSDREKVKPHYKEVSKSILNKLLDVVSKIHKAPGLSKALEDNPEKYESIRNFIDKQEDRTFKQSMEVMEDLRKDLVFLNEFGKAARMQ